MTWRNGSMKTWRVLPAALLVAIAFVPAPGRADPVVRAIDVKQNEFEPRGIGAVAGDTITWTWRSGNHTVTAYGREDVTFDQPMSGGPVSTFSHQYTGGLLKYYCKVHSAIDASGNCTGSMCGRVSDTPPTVQPPAITFPANGSTQSYHTFEVGGFVASGTALVKIKKDQATLAIAHVQGQSWRQWITLPNGTHSVTGIAVDQDGFESARSAALTVTVSSDDTKPPRVGISSPSSPLAASQLPVVSQIGTSGGHVGIAGDAIDDDTNIATVTITVTDAAGTAYPTDWVCRDCGTKKNVHFLANVVLLPGPYKITVEATDSVGLRVTATKDVIVAG